MALGMLAQRPHGAEQPGLAWGPFTLRLPWIHLRAEPPELIQGLLVANATGLAVVPLYAEMFGMSFETAVAMCVVQSLLICSAFLIFGDPYCPGWITPAIPLVLREAAQFETAGERTDFVNALLLLVAALFILFGATGLGKLFVRAVPPALKAAIILGAGMSAVYGEFIPRSGGRPARLEAFPVSILLAAGVTGLLMFSRPLERWKGRRRWLRRVASLGIAPGFFIAMAAGPWVGEVSYAAFRTQFFSPAGEWSFAFSQLFFWPDFGGLFAGYSVLERGLPSAGMFLLAAPLAFAAYVVAFGDIITGTAIVLEASVARPDEKIVIDERRTHLTLGLRNAAVAVAGGPFFPLQGPLWTGAMVVVAERYRQGRQQMDSLFSGVASYYFFGLPLLYFMRPPLELLRPVLDVAFSLTLLLTGFACAYVALAMVKDRIERGLIVVTGLVFMYYPTWIGLATGLALTLALLGRDAWREE